MFKKVKQRKIRNGQKIVRVYEYFLQGPKTHYSLHDLKELTKGVYDEEVEYEIEKLKKGGEILDISYHQMYVGYPRF